ncbi:DUF6415 family natural product biosynthesis protein [Streptomyces sp. NPDC058657]|uniref:DUF6415 family natural product biosynthesis protein n=1 Tax=unclassified Streptomyces TaxID=2593676 RepID=UPI0036575C29
MAALTPVVPDKVEVLALVEEVLAWDLQGPELPEPASSLVLVEQFTTYGKVLADDLGTLCLNIRASSQAGNGAQATLNEASRRLHLSPPPPGPLAAAHRAQNLARLTQALLRSIDQVNDEHARVTQHAHRHVTTKGASK